MDQQTIRGYYDEFSRRYEAARRPNDPLGYHALLDDLEIDLVRRYGVGKDVLEAGCGTGLLLERIAEFAARAEGFDLSPGMLEKARERGLSVREGSLTEIPFPDASFDVVCSFKVLAHVPDIRKALTEMARVTRPDGVVLAEFYNPYSLRGLAKRFGPAGAISPNRKESEVYTRFDSPAQVRRWIPPGCRLEGARGVRIVTPAAFLYRIPPLRKFLTRAEWALCDTPLHRFAGFWIAVLRKDQ
ncbi:MAG: methyltransferase domain-containing protein [Myxococcales bacterium]|nr:class I SAM-dependent methyltransferase [Polyangiaceae bacterium]MDW8249184.1 methyltransferase domain-containing protein [Myxococcales bacterium]